MTIPRTLVLLTLLRVGAGAEDWAGAMRPVNFAAASAGPQRQVEEIRKIMANLPPPLSGRLSGTWILTSQIGAVAAVNPKGISLPIKRGAFHDMTALGRIVLEPGRSMSFMTVTSVIAHHYDTGAVQANARLDAHGLLFDYTSGQNHYSYRCKDGNKQLICEVSRLVAGRRRGFSIQVFRRSTAKDDLRPH